MKHVSTSDYKKKFTIATLFLVNVTLCIVIVTLGLINVTSYLTM